VEVRPVQSALLADFPFVRHGLTFRLPGMGAAEGNMGYGPPRDQEDAWAMRQRWCEAVGLDPTRVVTMSQMHGAEVIRVTAEDTGRGATPSSASVGRADALITDAPNIALLTLHADCLPILIVDPIRPAVAAVHAGWRGTVAGVAVAAVRAMTDAFGSDPRELRAYLGAAIGGCCNEVGPEVTAAWRDYARDLGALAELAVSRPGAKEHFDGQRANALLLQHAGLLPEHVDVDWSCTRCEGDRWFSHRGQGPTTGREGAFIGLVPVLEAV
jgi:YfiH family protein